MAKRSDFAQKLLDDLRLRKERMAASQSSNRSKPIAADAYTYAKQTYRGQRDIKTKETTAFRTGNIHNRSSVGSKSLTSKDVSKQIVPFGKGQGPEQIDLSMALTFALGKGGKLGRMDSSSNNSMLGFLHQIGRGSVDFTNMGRNSVNMQWPSTSHFPTFSHLHIEEISKGAQRLNQILRACSNGLNFDRYSIEIGKELLKGAMDLEESLRMLVNLYEASENMISPQRKSRITLLDEDEDADSDAVKIAEQRQLDRPRFSFDRASRNSHNIQEVARHDLKPRLMALTYSTEVTNFHREKQAPPSSNSASHKRSVSYGPDAKTAATFLGQKNHSTSSKSKPEMGRIPNVIAKLMGLDELPENVDPKHTTNREISSKQRVEGTVPKKTAQGGNKNLDQKVKVFHDLTPPTIKQKQIQVNNRPHIQDTTFALQTGKSQVTLHASLDVVTPAGNPPRHGGIKPVTAPNKASIRIDKQQNNTAQLNQNTRNQKDIQEHERKQDNAKLREQKDRERFENKETMARHELQRLDPQNHTGLEASVVLQGQTESRESRLQPQKEYADMLLFANQQKFENDLGFQQPSMLQLSEPKQEKHQAEESEQQNFKQKVEVRKQKGSQTMSRDLQKPIHDTINLQKKHPQMNQITVNKRSPTESSNAMKPEGSPNDTDRDSIRHGSSTNFNSDMKESMTRKSSQNASPGQGAKVEREKTSIPPIMEEKPVHRPTAQKIRSAKVHKGETPRKIEEVMKRSNGLQSNMARPPKYYGSIVQEVKQRRHGKLSGPKEAEQEKDRRTSKVEAHNLKVNKSVSGFQPSSVAQKSQSGAEQVSTYNPLDSECQNTKEPHILTPIESCQTMTSTVRDVQQGQELVQREEELVSHKIVSHPLRGTYEETTDITCPTQPEHQKVSKSETPLPLTESENHLKMVLIKSQLFLNTAEALFKLNIPVGILHAGGIDCHDEDSKLILDCGYEVMRRKGKKQELSINPCMRISITSMKIISLDDLVKQLNKDFEKVKSYGRNGNAESVVEDYLPKMLEIDVYNQDPDVNCMWDLGWNETMFSVIEKDDVVRDVERYLVNGLLDEVTRDLLQVF